MAKAGRFKVVGADKLIKKLMDEAPKAAKKVARKAARAGGAIILKADKRNIPVDQGVLKKAQANKVSGKGFNITARVGAKTANLEADERRPSNIDYLVEYGHVAANGVFVPPSGAMRATAAEAGPPAVAKCTAVMKQGVEQALVK